MYERVKDFYERIADDGRIGMSHISLYMALVFQGKDSSQPFLITREEIMQLSKIKSRQTYNRCMNELKEYGYIGYTPSSDPFSGSLIVIVSLKKE